MTGRCRRALTIAIVAAAAVAGSACSHGNHTPPRQSTAAVGTSTHYLTWDGVQRSFLLYRPASLPPQAPLVLMLHGGFGSAGQAEQSYGWDALADREHVVIAYPNGLNRAWNVGDGCCGAPGRAGTDDVGFIEQVVAQVRRVVPVDPHRVYVTGMSNGAMLAYRLACDSSAFAAVAPVSGTLLGGCDSPHPVSVIHIHGTADRSVRYDGGRGSGVARIDGPPVPSIVALWRRVDGCGVPATTTNGLVRTDLAACPHGRAVELITIDGAGHQWPGGRSRTPVEKALGLDEPSRALDATSTIWQFFAAHPSI